MWKDIAWLPLNHLLCHCTPRDLQSYCGVTKARCVLWLGTKGQMLIISFMYTCRIIENPQGEYFCWFWRSEFLENKTNAEKENTKFISLPVVWQLRLWQDIGVFTALSLHIFDWFVILTTFLQYLTAKINIKQYPIIYTMISQRNHA